MKNYDESTTSVDTKSKRIPWWSLLVAAIYVVSPVDLIPDVIPIIGWIDDILVSLTSIIWTIQSIYIKYKS